MDLLVEFYTATSIFYVLNIILDLAALITNIKKIIIKITFHSTLISPLGSTLMSPLEVP